MLEVKNFNVRTLLEIDGNKLENAIKLGLKRVLDDLMDRPALRSSRKLTLELAFLPVVDASGTGGIITLDGAELKFKQKVTTPAQESATISLGMGVDGLTVNIDNPSNVNQHTLEFEEEDADADSV